jgi:transposase
MDINRMTIEHQVVLLAEQGMSRRAIARSLRIGRHRVNRILREQAARRARGHSAFPDKRPRAPRPSKLDAYRDDIARLLEQYPDITAQRVYEELRGKGFDGGRSIVKEAVRELRPAPAPKISLPTPDYGPGKMAENDWAQRPIPFTHVPARTMHFCGYVPVYSRRKCFSVHEQEDLHALMNGHVSAFERLKGVIAQCKYDGQKAVVLGWEGSQPIYNPRFIDFAVYYRFTPRACRPYHPNDKPRVERSFWELDRSFLNGRSFRDERDLAAQLAHWQDTVADHRRQRSSGQTALERFAEEAAHLVPLPAHPFDTARVVYRVCDVEGCVAWEGNAYEVPYEYVTQILPVRITQHELFIYAADLSCIARHELRRKGARQHARLSGRKVPTRAHRIDMDQLRLAYQELGAEAVAYFDGLVGTHRAAGHHARKILALRDRYRTGDLVHALTHALRFRAFDHRAIERILLARARPRRFDEYIAEDTARSLASIIEQSRTEPRPLADYDLLPCATHESTGEDSTCPPPDAPAPSNPPATSSAPDSDSIAGHSD